MYTSFRVNNKDVNAQVIGEGYPLIFLHGYLESSEIWMDFPERLSSQFKIVSIDLPGFGSSEVFGETHTMELFADTIVQVLDQMNIRKSFLIGHSLGGYVSLAMLEYFSERLDGLCLFHSHPYADNPQTIAKRNREIALVLQNKQELIFNINIPNAFSPGNLQKMEAFVDKAKQIAAKTSPEGIIAALRGMMLRPSRERILAETNIPVLLILGKEDNYIPFEDVGMKIPLPERSELIILEQSGHMGFCEEQEASLAALERFIHIFCRPDQAGRT
jgi:pimeloyl-ACP methyl ester carboxylesterase